LDLQKDGWTLVNLVLYSARVVAILGSGKTIYQAVTFVLAIPRSAD